MTDNEDVAREQFVARLTRELVDDPDIMRHLNAESTVEVLLRGHLWIERELTSAIEHRLVEPEHLRLERVPFSMKVRLASALGVLPLDMRRSVEAINTLRNHMAHDVQHSLDTDDMAALVQATPMIQGFPGLAARDPADQLRVVLVAVLLALRGLRF